MILEQLISAYLDGDLTIEQDRELRERMRTDPAAREAFDSAVLIHIAMRCEDDTVPPPDKRVAIFDAVDAIAAVNQAVAMRPVVRPRRQWRGAVAALVALIAFWLPVGDGLVPIGLLSPVAITESSVLDSEQRELSIVQGESPQMTPSGNVRTVAQLPTVSMNAEHVEVVDESVAVMSEPTGDALTPALGEGGAPEVPLGAYFQGAVRATTARASAPSQSGSTVPTEVIPWRDDRPVSVVVSTAYAAGVGSTIASAQNVEQVSASLAYGLSDADAIGFEIGSTSYSIEQSSAMLTTSEPVSSSMRTVVNGENGGGKFASPEDESGTYTTSAQERTEQVRSMWGTAFYERRLLDLNAVAILGRAGAGVSQEGILGFGRLTGQWTVGGGVAVIVGAEARSMPFQTGAGSRASSQISYGAIVTAVTGLQVRF